MIKTRFEALQIMRDGPVEWLTLNRPDQLNALNSIMIAELADYFDTVAHDDKVRVIVMRGAGRAFCAGLDIAEEWPVDAFEVHRILERQRRVSDLVLRMRRAPQPVVSLIHGPACGGGFALALASDIRIAGESARMNTAFIRIGLSACDMGVSYLLPRLIGASTASELMLTGDFIGASRALAVGLVSRVVPDSDLSAAAAPFLDAMLTTSPIGLRMTKEGLRLGIDAPNLDAAIAMEDRTQALCVATGAFVEGVAAFTEKRRPNY